MTRRSMAARWHPGQLQKTLHSCRPWGTSAPGSGPGKRDPSETQGNRPSLQHGQRRRRRRRRRCLKDAVVCVFRMMMFLLACLEDCLARCTDISPKGDPLKAGAIIKHNLGIALEGLKKVLDLVAHPSWLLSETDGRKKKRKEKESATKRKRNRDSHTRQVKRDKEKKREKRNKSKALRLNSPQHGIM